MTELLHVQNDIAKLEATIRRLEENLAEERARLDDMRKFVEFAQSKEDEIRDKLSASGLLSEEAINAALDAQFGRTGKRPRRQYRRRSQGVSEES